MRRSLLVVLVTVGDVLAGPPAEAAGPLQFGRINYDDKAYLRTPQGR